MSNSGDVGFVSSVARGVLVSVITALIGVLAFAFVAKLLMLDDGVIKVVNQFLKVLAIFLGCMFSPYRRLGLIKGGVIGVVGSLVIYLLFSLLVGQPVKIISIIIDLIFSLVVGAISGIISVNVRGD